MPHALLALAAVAQQAHEGPSSPFEVNFGLFIYTWVVFIVLFLLLKRFAWPAILKATEERERKIERQLAEAEKMHADARTALEENLRLLAEARAGAQAMIAEAKSLAEKERSIAVERARHEQEELLARGRREIAAEKDKAVAELRREAVDLSLAAASKLISQRLDSAADRSLVLDYLASLERH